MKGYHPDMMIDVYNRGKVPLKDYAKDDPDFMVARLCGLSKHYIKAGDRIAELEAQLHDSNTWLIRANGLLDEVEKWRDNYFGGENVEFELDEILAKRKDGGVVKYRKKPVVIEAMQFTNETKDRVFGFVRCNRDPGFDDDHNPTLIIQTLEGEMTAVLGDWIIKGVQGEFYPCKPDIFAMTYELVTEEVSDEITKA
jgi:hypothetical protein